MTTLVDKIVAVGGALEAAGMPWAFGGALALAYATEEPRGTRDIDVNVFVRPTDAQAVFAALPADVHATPADVATAQREGQVRLWWDDTPVDVFFAVDAFHLDVAHRCRSVHFVGHTVRILAAEDLAVFKALFDRPKDWVDIATMVDSGAVDAHVAADRVADLLGDDPRVERLRSLAGQ